MGRNHVLTFFWVFLTGLLSSGQTTESQKGAFDKLRAESWQQVFFDDGSEDWQEQWSLDGLRGMVKNTKEGMVFSAGPIRGDNGSHNVLWTKSSFEGDIKIEFDYTRLDDISYAVNILYIQATGIGEYPYVADIMQWANLREVPYMNRYFRHMNLLHISYAAYPLKEGSNPDYVRARRYPVRPGQSFGKDTRLSPDYENTGLFQPGVGYHFICIKKGDQLFLQVSNDEVARLFAWDTSTFESITEGRVGIRHMYTRAARYANVSISVLD
ncbi:MAG: DUF1961 family protein [Saprospiraceae bacterium]|nr:DUF1961 family protein [Saprospiraceae bacterium]